MLTLNSLWMRFIRRGKVSLFTTGLVFVIFIAIWQVVAFFSSSSLTNFFSGMTPNTYSVFEIDSFRTSMAKLTVVDILFVDNQKRLSVKRRIVNMDRDEIFVSEVELVLPQNLSQITDTRHLVVDYTKLNIAARPLVAPPFATGSLTYERNSKAKVLIIGLGGSQMNNFLHNAFPMMDITVVELEEQIVDIAKKYFGLSLNKKQRVFVMDGKKYLQKAALKETKFDAIYIDACPTRFPMEEEIMCPISAFLNPLTIKDVKNSLKSNGTLCVKMLLFVKDVTQAAERIADEYRKEFPYCTIMPMVSDLNRVLVCANRNVEEKRMTKDFLTSGLSNFVNHFKLENDSIR